MKARLFFTVLIAILLIGSTASAEVTKKNVDAYYNSINIKINNQRVDLENIIVGETSYVPLRTFSEILGKSIQWDDSTRTANVVDKQTRTTQASSAQPENKKTERLSFVFAFALQIAGTILLTQNLLLKGRKSIAYLAKHSNPANGSYLGVKRLLYENWIFRIGFVYLIGGTILHFLGYGTYNLNSITKAVVTGFASIIFLIVGWWLSKNLMKKQYPQVLDSFKQDTADDNFLFEN